MFRRSRETPGPIAAERARAGQAGLEREAALLRLRGQLQGAYTRWEGARRRVRFFGEKQLPAASHVVELARVGYQLGRTGLLNLFAGAVGAGHGPERRGRRATGGLGLVADLDEASGGW